MIPNIFLKRKKIGFIGGGKMTQALISSFLDAKALESEQIYVSNRSEGKLKKVTKLFGINPLSSNEELVETCDIIFLAVKPQDWIEATENVSPVFTADQIVISLMAGVEIKDLRKHIKAPQQIIRLMANTASRIGAAVVAYCSDQDNTSLIEGLFSHLGTVFQVPEGEPFDAFVVGTSSGVGFVFEMMLYWKGWLMEHNISAELAQSMTLETFKGACLLAGTNQRDFEQLRDEATSTKGVTHAGLQSFRESQLESILRLGFEQANLRQQKLRQDLG